MTTEKEFICVCGKHFTNGQTFNGHKSGCKVHIEHKYGSLDSLIEKHTRTSQTAKATYAKITNDLQSKKLTNWLATEPKCESCGCNMTTKFGSGRFCSKACANRRQLSSETKQQIRTTLKTTVRANLINNSTVWHDKHLNAYNENPSYCVICNTVIPYEKRRRKTCSERCKLLWSKQVAGGLRQGSGTGKHGWYRGYYCDSSYELAYVIYNLDHNIYFERNKKAYSYIGTDNKVHKYYPDFIENEALIEIKGYWTENVQRKLDAVDDLPIKLLMKKDIQYMIDYVKQTYNCSDITVLYEN